jgi:hypothetical protein
MLMQMRMKMIEVIAMIAVQVESVEVNSIEVLAE